MSKFLTVEETAWLSARGYEQGWDVDTVSPRLNHIVTITSLAEHGQALCSTPNLWGHVSWSASREEATELLCADCVACFDTLYQRHLTGLARGFDGSIAVAATIDEIAARVRGDGRPDVALLLDAALEAWYSGSGISEEVLLYLVRLTAAAKRDNISLALELLEHKDR